MLEGYVLMGVGRLKRFFKKENSTEEEILELVAEEENDLEISKRKMINNVFEFADTNAGDIMTHRTDIVAVEDDKTLYDVVEAAIDEGVSRVPIFHENLDDILGIIYVKDLLKFVGTEMSKDEKLKDYYREPMLVPETIPCGKLFAEMTEKRTQLAIVVDEYGGTAGLVTLEDIIEELVGDIEDEYDEEEINIERFDDNIYKIDSETEIDEVEEALGIKFPEDATYSTIAGFMINQLGYIPSENKDEGVEVIFNNVKFTIWEIDKRQIDVIKAEIL